MLMGASSPPPAGAVAFIVIYSDPTTREIESLAQPAVRLGRGLGALGTPPTKQRVHNSLFEERLKVWDAYAEARTFAAVARALRLPMSRVRRRWFEAHLDIEGRPPAGPIKERRAGGISPENAAAHLRGCQRCSTATSVHGFCRGIAAYVDQGSRAARELALPESKLVALAAKVEDEDHGFFK
jgi:hypothetical protein